jgi:hypothetical protein
MTRSAAWLLLVFASALGCGKPSDDDCRKAILNMQHIRDLDKDSQGQDAERWVRKCRATGNTEVVRCLIAAKTADDLGACEKK